MITSNRDVSEWPLVFANPLMSSACMDRLVNRATKLVIEGSERPGSISAPAQIAVDERRTRRRYGGACVRLTDRPTN